VGISNLSLSIAALLGNRDQTGIKNIMERISMKKVKAVRDENIGDTLLTQKRNLFKKYRVKFFHEDRYFLHSTLVVARMLMAMRQTITSFPLTVNNC
jgi:hypothetical protein